MVSRRELPAMVAAEDLAFGSVAAQDLGFTGNRGYSIASCTKRKRAMRRSNGMGVGRHRDEHNPTKRFLRSKEGPVAERLFPGIPDEITWDLIVPKLSWRALPVLSSVSRAWREAIRTNRVYEEKVRANSLETLLIHNHEEGIALYSTSNNCCYKLPPIPVLPSGAVQFCRCIALGGKIYILGGMEVEGGNRVLESGRVVRYPLTSRGFNASGKVHMLDLGGGQWQWEQCTSMLEPRYSFGCGVIDDKIYVVGGTSEVCKGGDVPALVLRCEVYDTQENAWSPIMPMRPSIVIGGVPIAAPIGKELVVFDRYNPTVGVYNPAKDEWKLELFWEQDYQSVGFVTEGKFYSLSQTGIDVYDVNQKLWINRHTHSFAALRPDDSAILHPRFVSAVKDELFLAAYWDFGARRFLQSFHCKGFDGEKKEIVWQKRNCSVRRYGGPLVQFPIQL